jgi:zinc transporter ZupT
MGMILSIFILFSGPLLGVLLQRILKVHSHRFIGHTVAFSGAFLMGIALFGLMPELFDHIKIAGLWIVLGFLFQIFLERFTGGVGHGHIHSHDLPKSELILFSGLMLHAVLEGYSAGLSQFLGQGFSYSMIVGIAIHEIPAAFSLSVLMHSKWKQSSHVYAFLLLYIFATPIGYTLGVWVHEANVMSDNLIHIVMAIIAGIFLHISTTIVFEHSLRKKEGRNKWVLIILGLLVSYLACSLG